MTGRGFSQPAWDREYRAVVTRAFATVPYYREMWADAGARLAEPLATPVSRLDSSSARLYPLGAPYERRREAPEWTGEPGELFEALELTGGHRRDRPLFEVREALLDWDRIGPGGARYHVVLSAAAEVADPELRQAGLRVFRAAHEPALLGDAAQIAQVAELAGHPGRVRVFLRRSPATLGEPTGPGEQSGGQFRAQSYEHSRERSGARPDKQTGERPDKLPGKQTGERYGPPDGPPPAGEVLYDPRLGYLGARHRDCGHAHLNWRRVHVRRNQAGPLFTLLRRRRPTLANISLPGTAHLTVDRCREHGTPILTAGEVTT